MVVAAKNGSYRYAGFNCKDRLFTDPDIRRAFCMAVDMDSAVDAIFKNDAGAVLAKRAYGPIPLEVPGANEAKWKEICPKYDPGGAKKILESKGWALGSDGIYAKDGKKFNFALKVGNNDTAREKLSVIISTSLKKIGVACTAQATEWATLIADIKAGNTQMFIMGGASGLDGMYMLFDSKIQQTSSHNTFFNTPELDALLSKASATIKKDARAEVLTEASLIAVKNCPHLFGYFEYSQIGVNRRVKGFAENPTCWFSMTNSSRNIDIP